MKDTRWQRAKEIFDEARHLAPGLRASFIDTECAGDKQIRAEVEMLLASYESDFLEENVLGAANLLIEPGLPSGQVIGRYTIGEFMGSGGLGRVLNVGTARKARLRRLEAEPTDSGLSIRFEIDDPGDHRAEALARRLEACPAVTQLAFGWRGGLAQPRMSPN